VLSGAKERQRTDERSEVPLARKKNRQWVGRRSRALTHISLRPALPTHWRFKSQWRPSHLRQLAGHPKSSKVDDECLEAVGCYQAPSTFGPCGSVFEEPHGETLDVRRLKGAEGQWGPNQNEAERPTFHGIQTLGFFIQIPWVVGPPFASLNILVMSPTVPRASLFSSSLFFFLVATVNSV
jgi:hypothetical protein